MKVIEVQEQLLMVLRAAIVIYDGLNLFDIHNERTSLTINTSIQLKLY